MVLTESIVAKLSKLILLFDIAYLDKFLRRIDFYLPLNGFESLNLTCVNLTTFNYYSFNCCETGDKKD